MTITLENRNNNNIIHVERVSSFSCGCTANGRTGFGVNYADGTFYLFPGSEWKLIFVKQ